MTEITPEAARASVHVNHAQDREAVAYLMEEVAGSSNDVAGESDLLRRVALQRPEATELNALERLDGLDSFLGDLSVMTMIETMPLLDELCHEIDDAWRRLASARIADHFGLPPGVVIRRPEAKDRYKPVTTDFRALTVEATAMTSRLRGLHVIQVDYAFSKVSAAASR